MFLSNRKSCCAVAGVRSRLSKRNVFCLRGIVYGELSAPMRYNVFQAGVRFLLCQVTHLSANPQKMVACLVLAGRNRHPVASRLRVRFFVEFETSNQNVNANGDCKNWYKKKVVWSSRIDEGKC
jgi:hypothetical protein